ncbi:MAG: hypothetical protein HYV32_02215 [Candidatus Kerfeldbacteria bacterium]|nr:hypothetical protein [Candidatus Kerfeldbacteria bacterium]
MKKKTIGALSGAMLSILFVAAPAVHAQTAQEKLQAAVNELQTRIESRITEIQALEDSGASDVEIRIATAEDVLTQADADIETAYSKIPFLLFANVAEKKIMFTQLMVIRSEVRVQLEAVQAIDADLQATTITEEEATAQLDAQLQEIEDYFVANKDAFKDTAFEFLQLKVKAFNTYMQWSLNYAQLTADAYQTLGYDTTRTEALIILAQADYDAGATLYAAAKDGDDDSDVEDMASAGKSFLKARANLAKAEVRLRVMEKDWTDNNTNEGTDDTEQE